MLRARISGAKNPTLSATTEDEEVTDTQPEDGKNSSSGSRMIIISESQKLCLVATTEGAQLRVRDEKSTRIGSGAFFTSDG